MRVALTAGYWSSKSAIALICELTRRGHQVPLCLVASVINLKRVRNYWRTYKKDLFSMVPRRLWGSGGPAETQAEDMQPVAEYLESNGWYYKTVRAAARSRGTKVLGVDDLNSPKAIGALRHFTPDLLIYSGGGILRKPLLEVPSKGTLNAHAGHLPEIRGMNALEWSLLLGVQPGVTVHFIDPGIDTGPILSFFPIAIRKGGTIASIRGEAILAGVRRLCDTVDQIAAQTDRTLSQSPGQGKQYFVMHARLKKVIESALQRGTFNVPA